MLWEKGKVIDRAGNYLGTSPYFWDSDNGYRISVCHMTGPDIYEVWCLYPRFVLSTLYHSLASAKAAAYRHHKKHATNNPMKRAG